MADDWLHATYYRNAAQLHMLDYVLSLKCHYAQLHLAVVQAGSSSNQSLFNAVSHDTIAGYVDCLAYTLLCAGQVSV